MKIIKKNTKSKIENKQKSKTENKNIKRTLSIKRQSKKLKKQSNQNVMTGTTQKKNPYAKKHTYKYLDKNNKKITSKKTLEHIKTLRIPPGYKDVVISHSPHSDIQAIGTDDKGRKQYIYNPQFVKKKQDEKYENIIKLGTNIDKIIKDIDKIINANYKNPVNQWQHPDTVIALVIFLLYKCNFRIGNMKYVKAYNSYGALTLKPKHLKMKGNNLFISFIGKKGVENTAIISDKKIITMLTKLQRNVKEFIFEDPDTGNPLNITYINDFLRKYDEMITPKMFRTWYANYYFLEVIKKDISKDIKSLLDICSSKTKIKSYLKKCCEYVADKLNNTAAISKKSYLDSEIIDIFTGDPCRFINFLAQHKRMSNNDLLVKIMTKIK